MSRGPADAGKNPVGDENDLAAVRPLGHFDGQCCPCPEHQVPPDGSPSAELESCSTRLALYADAAKTSAQGNTVSAGQAVWVEGQTASTSVGADRIVWKWTDGEDRVHRVTNAFTVLSVRLFGDVNLDGQVDAADKVLHPALSREHGWAMPVATNVYRPLRLRTDVGLSGGAYSLALSGQAGAVRVWRDASGTNAAPLLVSGQTVTNGVGGVSFLTGEDSDLFVEAVSNGTATLTYAYSGTGEAAGVSCSASLKMMAYRVTLEPVTIEANGLGTIFNPCGVATNGLAAYRVRVEPSSDIPDSAIHWSIASGGVTFYGGNSTGRDVIVRGGASESDFKLEVEVDGHPLAVKPYIHGRVLEQKTVVVRAYSICDSNGVPAVASSTISNWVTEANRIYRQAAVTFTLAGVQNVYGHDSWFEIGSDDEFYQMTSYTNGTGGLELYCVKNMNVAEGLHSDFNLIAGDVRRGMAVSADAHLMTFAHELGHAFGLRDLYDYDGGDGLVSEDKVTPLNWSGGEGTGYYSATLAYRDLAYRCIMEKTHLSSARGDIPLDNLTGMSGSIRIPVSVGLEQMTTRQPEH